MQGGTRFEVLTAQHDVASFWCESGALTSYIRHHALLETQKEAVRTFLLVDYPTEGGAPTILGFFSLTVDQLAYPDPEAPHKTAHTPVVYLSYIARDQRARDLLTKQKGEPVRIGLTLMIQVFRIVAYLSQYVAIQAIYQDSNDVGRAFYQRMQFRPSPISPQSYIKPIREIREYLEELEISWQHDPLAA